MNRVCPLTAMQNGTPGKVSVPSEYVKKKFVYSERIGCLKLLLNTSLMMLTVNLKDCSACLISALLLGVGNVTWIQSSHFTIKWEKAFL